MSAGPRDPGFDPFAPGAIENPYPLYRAQRETSPVSWSVKLRSWLLFRHDDTTAFFRDDGRLSSDRLQARKFAAAGGAARAAPLRTVSSDPPAHTPVRAILNAVLAPRVRAIRPRVEELLDLLLERLPDVVGRTVTGAGHSGEIDLVEELAYPLPIHVIAELLGIREEDWPRFRESSRAVAHGMDRFYSGGTGEGLQAMGAYFLGLVAQRKGTTGNDLVRGLVEAAHRGERLSDLEVVAVCTALVFGGHETTVNLIATGVLSLLRDPEALAQVRRDPSGIDAAVEEMLRTESPAQLVARTARVDFELRGRPIRAGDSVVAVIGAANRDPEAFPDPERFDPAREPNPHLAFGLGTHFCPGAQLSRIEARLTIPALLERFPNLRAGDFPPVWRRTAVLRGLERLPVRLD